MRRSPKVLATHGSLIGFCLTILTGFTLFTANGTFIKWDVDNGDSVPFILNTSGCDCDLTEDEIEQTYLRAMDKWNEVKGSHFQFANLADTSPELFEQDPNLSSKEPEFDDGYNVIGFVDDIPPGVAGFATFKVEGRHITEADVSLGAGLGYDASLLENLVAHEFGHALGLGHDHADAASIMSYERDDNRLRLGVDDIIGITTLYPKSGREPKPDLGCSTILPIDGDPPFFDQALLNFAFMVLLLGGLFSLTKRYAKRQHPIIPSFAGGSLGKGSLWGICVLLLVMACGEALDDEPTTGIEPELYAHLEKHGHILDLAKQKAQTTQEPQEVSFYFGTRTAAISLDDTPFGPIIEGGNVFNLTRPTLNGDKVTFFCPEGR